MTTEAVEDQTEDKVDKDWVAVKADTNWVTDEVDEDRTVVEEAETDDTAMEVTDEIAPITYLVRQRTAPGTMTKRESK